MKKNIQHSTFNTEHPSAVVRPRMERRPPARPVSANRDQCADLEIGAPGVPLVKVLMATVLALMLGVAGLFAQTATKPAVGDPAPLFSGLTQDGKTWRLADAVGKKVVLLYFYPKDDTPGCTKEACGLRDRMGDLQKADVEVIGVSFDSAESHQKFIAKHNLNFTLLADADGKIADAYGVRMAGKSMARRVSFLIGKAGKILHVTDAQSADTHLTEMSAAVAKLKTN